MPKSSLRTTDTTVGFFDLPIETRLQVYRELIKPDIRYCPFDNLAIHSAAFGFHPAVLRGNKTIYREASTVFYGENTWHINIFYDFNFFSLVPGLDNLQNFPLFPLMRNFHLRFSFQGFVMDEYPSLRLEKYCAALQVNAKNTCQVLGRAPDLRTVEISWADTTYGGCWEEKLQVLDTLQALPSTCSYRIREVQSKHSRLDRQCLIEYLSTFMKARHCAE